jgi:hypothetical protein
MTIPVISQSSNISLTVLLVSVYGMGSTRLQRKS